MCIRGRAKVEAMSKDAITLSHGPIPALKWGSMTMEFKPPPAKDLPRNMAAGDRVSFEFYVDAEGLPQISQISQISPSPNTGAKK